MPRVLVTGGAGFIGSHVIDRFVQGGYEVVCLDDLSTGRRSNVPVDGQLNVLDVQSPDTANLIRGGRFDAIAHLAAQVDVRKSVADPIGDLQTNIIGMVNVLEAVRSLPVGQRPRVIFASTGGALYGDASRFPTDEDADTNPDAPYGIGKLAAEYYLAYYGRVWGLETVVLRFGNVYGPRQDTRGEGGVIAIFTKRLLEGRPLTVYGNGRQTRDYVYVGDVANAFFAAATTPTPPAGPPTSRAFNVGTAVETSVNELVGALSEVTGTNAVVEYAPRRTGEIDRSVLDIRKAQERLGWTADVLLRPGLEKTHRWLAAQTPDPDDDLLTN